MPDYSLVITEVTRYGTLFCVAGWDVSKRRMIRPEPMTAKAGDEASRFWDMRYAGKDRIFAVGNVVRFKGSFPPAQFPFPHATEDRLVAPRNCEVVGRMSLPEVARTVAPGISASLHEAFGGRLQMGNSGKAFVAAGTQTHSLDAIEIDPDEISFFEDTSRNERKLRAHLRQNGMDYDISITSDAVKSRFKAGGIAALEADASASRRIHVRLGLSRPFVNMPNNCYLQVNGLYFL